MVIFNVTIAYSLSTFVLLQSCVYQSVDNFFSAHKIANIIRIRLIWESKKKIPMYFRDFFCNADLISVELWIISYLLHFFLFHRVDFEPQSSHGYRVFFDITSGLRAIGGWGDYYEFICVRRMVENDK